MVANLIGSSIAKWKAEVIDSLFIAHEAELIKSIPLSATLPADKIVWFETTNGNFTMRSAYKLAASLFKSRSCGTTSDGSLLRKFWKNFGLCPFLIRCAIFVGMLVVTLYQPTKVKLRRRNVIAEDVCVLSGKC